MQETHLGEYHVEVANTLIQLGNNLLTANAMEACEDALYRALLIREDKLGKYHQLSAHCMAKLCHVLKVHTHNSTLIIDGYNQNKLVIFVCCLTQLTVVCSIFVYYE